MNRRLLLSIGIAVAAVSAAAFNDRSTHRVGGERFAVPRELQFNDTIPWLPILEGDSFTFLLNANANPKRIPPHRVLVQSQREACGSDRMSQIVKVACGREEARLNVGPPFKKVFTFADYPHAWEYYAVGPAKADGKAEQLQVAYCSPISPNPARPKGTAICTSVWGVAGLVLSLGFEEHELAQLPLMRARATELLLSWKVR